MSDGAWDKINTFEAWWTSKFLRLDNWWTPSTRFPSLRLKIKQKVRMDLILWKYFFVVLIY